MTEEAQPAEGLVRGADGQCRCRWAGSDPLYCDYHDKEWGRPVGDDRRLYEKLCLEGFQSGLAWITILRKRPAFRAAFADFDPAAVARFDDRDVERLVGDAGIVRHRGKIVSTINNARRALELIDEAGSIAAFVWRYEPDRSARPDRLDHAAARLLTETEASRALAKALKSRGWTFVGPTTVYAFMQSVGLVNDHIEGCIVREEAEAARAAFVRPR